MAECGLGRKLDEDTLHARTEDRADLPEAQRIRPGLGSGSQRTWYNYLALLMEI